jgi:tetratricopeptide (TPR) repeat protein
MDITFRRSTLAAAFSSLSLCVILPVPASLAANQQVETTWTAQRIATAEAKPSSDAGLWPINRDAAQLKPAPAEPSANLSPQQKERLNTHISEVSERLRSNPKNDRLYALRGDLYRQLGDYNTALNDFNVAITINVREPLYYELRASALAALDRCDLAIIDVNGAIQLTAKNPALYILRARLYMQSPDLKAALADTNNALKFDPENIEALILAGAICSRMNQWKESLSYSNAAIEIDPMSSDAYAQRALAYEHLGLRSLDTPDRTKLGSKASPSL